MIFESRGPLSATMPLEFTQWQQSPKATKKALQVRQSSLQYTTLLSLPCCSSLTLADSRLLASVVRLSSVQKIQKVDIENDDRNCDRYNLSHATDLKCFIFIFTILAAR